MKMRCLLAASLLTLAMSATAEARTYEHGARPQAYNGEERREVAAPALERGLHEGSRPKRM